MKRVYIRVDGNEIIATGHVMRCLSVAEQLRKLGAMVTFVVADDRPCELIERKGFEVDVLHTAWDDLEKEIDIFQEYVFKNKVEIVLLDTYYATTLYMEELSRLINIIYVDDLCRETWPVHSLIHYWAFADSAQYKKAYTKQGENEGFLIGGMYAPLREEFSYIPYDVNENVQKVLITTGGTDQLNVAGNLLEKILSDDICSQLEYYVIVGCFNQNRDKLLALKQNHSNIHLHDNVTNMSNWMRACDVAISAAGTTMYELCACEIPSICLEVADNQEGAIRWEQEGYMKYAGNAYKDMENCLNGCLQALKEYVGSYEERVEKSKCMQSLIDGNGAYRIAEYIINEMEAVTD